MSWVVQEDGLPHGSADVLSTLLCVGNGQFTTRGTHSEQRFGAYRGVYAAGLYTRAPWGLMYLMQAPDWLPAMVRISGCQITDSQRTLDMRSGVLRRTAVVRGPSTEIRFVEERFASMASPWLMGQRLTVNLDSADGPVEVLLGIDGEVRNHKAKYYQPGQFPAVDATGLKLSTIQSLVATADKLEVSLAARASRAWAAATGLVRASGPGQPAAVPSAADGRASVSFWLHGRGDRGKTFVFEKLVALGADAGGAPQALQLHQEHAQQLRQLSYDKALAQHQAALQEFWDLADVRIDGDPQAQWAVRYALWSTRIGAPLDEGTSSMGAKNLSGDWYRGAVFWDMEMYQVPLLAAVDPARARNHVLYRARRLDSARTLAAQDGYDGARYPWHSYQSGLEEPPQLGGFLYQQQHVCLAVGWGIIHYHQLSDDDQTLLEHGLEVLIELCRFWASRAGEPDAQGQRHISGICGPDENHPNVTDNAYTNRMAIWLLEYTDGLIERLSRGHAPATAKLLEKLHVDNAVRRGWREVAATLHVPMLRPQVPAVCADYEKLPEPDDSLQGLGADRRCKQADTLMLFQALGRQLPPSMAAASYGEYAPLCLHNSSLSLSTHGLLAIRLGLLRDAMKFYRMGLGADLADSMGNTGDGIHAAAQGGIWLSTVWGFGGLEVGPRLRIDPMLPPTWRLLEYRLLYRGQKLLVQVGPKEVRVRNEGTQAVELDLAGKAVQIAGGSTAAAPCVARWQEPALQAVIFDLDGVLVSTDQFHYQAWQELADELGLPFNPQINHKLRGVSREDSLRIIYGERPLPSAEQFATQCARKNARYLELVSAMTPADVLPGALELIKALRGQGVRIGIASASRNCRAVLARTSLDVWVDAVSDGSCIRASKPDPSGFFVAAQRLRVMPWNCVGVEDAATGIEAIRRAGMAALGIGPQAAGADMTVHSIGQVTPALLRQLFAEHESPIDPYLERHLAHVKYEMQAGYAATMSFGQAKGK